MTNSLEALRYRRGFLEVLDQKQLPSVFHFDPCLTAKDGFDAIASMRVRGAPAIAITAALSLAVEIWNLRQTFASPVQLKEHIFSNLDYLGRSRPTAVNLFEAIGRLKDLIEKKTFALTHNDTGASELVAFFVENAEAMLAKDVSDNKAIGEFGAQALLAQQKSPLRILTHCNTGSLATAAYGTALGIIRSLHQKGQLEHAYCTETRPYNQGARLTAFELVYEKIPSTLITDSMAAFLMAQKGLHGVVVGADRVVANGDTANKIGTYALAIAAKHHGVPFYVAAPLTSIDLSKNHGREIPIELRPENELTDVQGVRIAAPGIGVWNPGFDITPADLITGIVTEKGMFQKTPGQNHFDLREALKSPL
jgi:methylthioribose-1-phosphate isomerase